MKKNDIEKMLLNDSEYEKLVKKRIENDFLQELKHPKQTISQEITDIKKVPANKLFSKNAIFEVLNKASKTKSYINGIQAEGYLGAQNSDRQKLLSGETDSFVCENSYIKFIKLEVQYV